MATAVQQLVIQHLLAMGPQYGTTRAHNHNHKQPKQLHKSKFLLLLLASLLAPLASATSNLNSIWLTADDNQLPDGGGGVSSRETPQLTATKYPEEVRLQVSSSSHHPTVASLEHQHHNTASSSKPPQEFERRSNIAEEQRLANLDAPTVDLNQTTNAHVEFDEEHQATPGQQAAANRRQDSDTSSRPQQAQNNIQVEERTSARSNLTQNSQSASNSSSQHHQSPNNNSSLQQQPFIYYMTDGDKWNQHDKSSTYEQASSNSQQQNSDSLTLAPGARSLPASGNHQQHSDADIVSYVSDKSQSSTSNVEQHPPPLPTTQPWTEQEVRYPTNAPQSQTKYEQQHINMLKSQLPSALPATVLAPIQARHLNGVPASALTPLVYTTNVANLPLFAQLDSSLKQVGPRYLLQPRREFRYPSGFVQPAVEANGGRRTARPESSNGFRYRLAQNSRPRPRRSFFEILGSRINSWVDPESNKPGLDEEFWGESKPSHKPKRRVRSPRPKSTASMSIYAAEPSVMQAVYIRSPNHLYYPQSFYSPPSSSSSSLTGSSPSSGSDLLLTRPTLAYLAPVRQPQVAYPPRAFADKFYSDSIQDASSRGSHLTSATDATAPHPPSPHHAAQSGHRPAGFVPVVAVSVTRTSPHPRIPVASNEAGSRSGGGSSEQSNINPELLEYLEMKTGAPRLNQQHRAPQEDPTSNQAASSGSINRQTDTYPYKIRSALMDHSAASGVGEQTTTVKSAVFGFYPHEAQKPLLQAIGFLPQYAGLRPLVGSRAGTTGASGSRLHEPSDQMNLLEAPEESPSLMLQLQASNFAQNDIAYPFRALRLTQADSTNGAYPATGPQLFSTSDSSNYRPIDVYPMNRQQFPAYQIIQPAHAAPLMNPLLAAATTSTVAGAGARPNGQLLAVAGSDMSPLFGARHNGQLMLASRPSVRPFMAGANQAASMDEQHYYSTRQPAALSASSVSFPFLTVNGGAAAATTGPDDNESEQSVQEDSSHQAAGGRGHNQVNKQGKKRSSEFFASAGQLLLSALPLLLAPTLGLMFASAPLPVARYQAPINPAGASAAFGSSSGSGSGSLHSASQSGIPGNYINSFSTPGHVHNASPAQLFTPAPQSYSTSSPAAAASTTTTTTTTTPTTSAAAATSATPAANSTRSATKLLPSVVGTVHRSVMVGGIPQPPTPSPASLLMLARNRSTVTPAPQRLLIALTTTGPLAIYTGPGSAPSTQHNVSLLEPANHGSASLTNGEPFQHHFHQHVGNTIVMLASPDEQANHNTSALHYEGYDGADFDAQFADLDGGSSSGSQNNNNNNNNSADGNLALLEADSIQSLNNKTAPAPEPLRLYPVSTWPPLRRRTVSLVTSNGNRTYSAELPHSDRYHHHQLELYQPMNQGLGSYSARQRVTRVRREASQQQQQPEVGPAEPKRRRIKRPTPSLTNSSHRQQLHATGKPTVKRKHQREVLTSEDSRNKAAHIFTTIMAQVADENELEGHSSRPIYGSGSGSRDFEGGLAWAQEQSSNPHTNYDQQQQQQQQQEQEDHRHQQQPPIDGLAVGNLAPETVGKKQAARDKIPGARLSMSRPHKLQLAAAAAQAESSEEPEMEPNDSPATMQLGRARGHFPPTLAESPSLMAMGPPRSYQVVGNRVTHANSNRPAARTNDVGARQRQRAAGPPSEPERIFITDDTKQALMNFNSLLIKDTLAGASQEPQFTGSQQVGYEPRRSDSLAKRQVLSDNSPPESIHLWRVVSKRPRSRQDRDTQETSGSASRSQPEESSADEPVPLNQRPEAGPRNSTSYSGFVNQVNLIENDDPSYYSEAGSPAYEERSPGGQQQQQQQHEPQHYEARLHSEPLDYYPPHHQLSPNNNRQESELNQIWRHNLSDGSAGANPIPVDSSRPKPARRRYLNTVAAHQQQLHPNSILYDLILANRSQSINSSNAFSPSDSRPPVRAQTPPPPPPLPHYNQQQPGGYSSSGAHYVPSQYSSEQQAYQHHEHRPRSYHQPASSDGSQQFNSYNGAAEQHSTRSQYSQGTGYTSAVNQQQQPTTDYLSEQQQPHWNPQQQSQQHQLDRSGAGETRAVNDYLKRAQFSDSDRDKLMASYLTCDGLLNDGDHCLERLSCEFSDPRNIEQANKLDRAVSSILLGHILTNTYIPNQFKQRLKSASLFGYLRQGSCSRFACHKLINRQQQQQPLSS